MTTLQLVHWLCLLSVAYASLSSSPSPHHRSHHRRRSVDKDARWLGFRFVSEPGWSEEATRFAGAGSKVVLECAYEMVAGNAGREVRVEWRKDAAPLAVGARNARLQQLSNGSLSLSGLSTADEGAYQCAVLVTTSATSADSKNKDATWTFLSKSAQVRLPSLGRFEQQPVDRAVRRGQPTAFQCIVDASPKAEVRWFHKDRLVQEGDGLHVFPISSTLEISNVRPRHEGEYRCEVSTAGRNRSSQAATLSISSATGSSEWSKELHVVLAPRGQSVDEGGSLVLECLAAGQPTPDVTWLKDGTTLAVDGDRVKRIGSGSLLISKATVEDAGEYTCRMSNGEANVERAANVQVRIPPHITTRPQDKTAMETADVELECVASGRPSPSITWLKNGELIVASEYFVIEPSRLRVLGLVATDQAVYECVAENDAGVATAAAQLLVDNADSATLAGVAAAEGEPKVSSQPLGLKVSSFLSRSAIVHWDPPLNAHGHVLAYHVFWKDVDDGRERTANTTQTTLTLTELQPDTSYEVRVAAENEAGIGLHSGNVRFTTQKEQAVPGKVRDLRAEATGPETIAVRWQPPPAGGPAALEYRLFYVREPAGNEKETQITVRGGGATAYTLHGMDKFATYAIRVEAVGENGPGLSTDPVQVRTQSDMPSAAPEGITAEALSSNSIRVKWTSPDPRLTNGDITGYKIRYKTKSRGSNGNTIVVEGDTTEKIVDGLEPGTQYMLRMAVVNQNGTGPHSDWVRVDTPSQDREEAQLAGPPVNLNARATSDSILLQWVPPGDDSVVIRGYQIGWGINLPDVESTKVGPNVRQHRITGLRPGKDYVVSLRAFNNIGTGFPIYETVRTSNAGAPPADFGSMLDEGGDAPLTGTPMGVRAEATGSTSLRVSWSDLDAGDEFGRVYTVRYSTSSDGGQHRFVNTSELSVELEGLRPASEYEVAVRAIAGGFSGGGGGVSPWSMVARNRTRPAAPSSAPRDLTALPAPSGDPQAVTLNWQPPKYANGEIEEYLIYFTDRPSQPDKDWSINYVSGDRLGHAISNLLPKATYYFKIQARNEKGYGPMSPVLEYQPGGGATVGGHSHGGNRKGSSHGAFDASNLHELLQVALSNPMYVAVLAAFAVLFLLAVILVFVCVCKKSSTQKTPAGYTQGKRVNGGAGGGDLWINHPSGNHLRGPEYSSDALGSMGDMKTLAVAMEYGRDGAPTRYQTMPGGGTLSRSYHQSSTSLEGTAQRAPRTPQVVYTGNGRHQPIAKIDFNECSPYGSSGGLSGVGLQPTSDLTTPPLPGGPPPVGPPNALIQDGYRTLRGNNPLRSFTQIANATPPPPGTPERTAAAVVRPIVVAASGARQLPVGRAAAQPRVNVAAAQIFVPYSVGASAEPPEDPDTVAAEKARIRARGDMLDSEECKPLQGSNSTENLDGELNAMNENIDTMIDDLQALQNEFV